METSNDFASTACLFFVGIFTINRGLVTKPFWWQLLAPSNLIVSIRQGCDYKRLLIPLVADPYQAKHMQREMQSLDFCWIWFPLNSDDPSKAAVMNWNVLKWKPFLPSQTKMFTGNFSPISRTVLVVPVSLPVVFAAYRRPLRDTRV